MVRARGALADLLTAVEEGEGKLKPGRGEPRETSEGSIDTEPPAPTEETTR